MPALSRAEIDDALRDDPSRELDSEFYDEPGSDYDRFEPVRGPTANEATFIAQGFTPDIATELADRFNTHDTYLNEVQAGRAYTASQNMPYWYVVDYWSSVDADNGQPPRPCRVQPDGEPDEYPRRQQVRVSGSRFTYQPCARCGAQAVFPLKNGIPSRKPHPHFTESAGYCRG